MSNGTVPKPSLAYYDFFKTNVMGPKDTVWYPEGPSLTRQEFADECDINFIMARYEKTGVLPANVGEPMYVDFTQMPSGLMDAFAMFDEAQKAFMTLPASVRKEFDNSAEAFVDFASDPGNLEQMRRWGLAAPAAVADAPKAGDSPPPAPPAEPAPAGSAGS